MSQGRPRQDSNLRTRLRRPLLYPLSYEGGAAHATTGLSGAPESRGLDAPPRMARVSVQTEPCDAGIGRFARTWRVKTSRRCATAAEADLAFQRYVFNLSASASNRP